MNALKALLLLALSLLPAANSLASGKIVTPTFLVAPVTAQPNTTDLKGGSFGTVLLTDHQKFESLIVSVQKRNPGVRVTVTVVTLGNYGAWVRPSTVSVQLANTSPAITAVQSTQPDNMYLFTPMVTLDWYTECRLNHSFSKSVDIPDANFDDINAIYMVPVVAYDVAC